MEEEAKMDGKREEAGDRKGDGSGGKGNGMKDGVDGMILE